tara:strand:+ start:8011 stop:8940 length:930 start_codon:yes stop_codon:yes gene_type:complete
MIPQFDNKVMSSFLLWFDHTLARDGEAWENTSSWFYPVENLYNGLYTYGAPYKQFVSDVSVTGAGVIYPNQKTSKHVSVPTGVYVSGSLIGTGQNGFSGINYDKGQVYFQNPIENPTTSISGDFAVKDFNVYLTNEAEEKLLFETKFDLRPKVAKTATGLAANAITYPAIFLRYNGSSSESFAFGGHDMTKMNIRAVVLSDSQYKLDAVCSIFRDTIHEYVTLLGTGDMPFNTFGDYKSGYQYNYTGLVADKDTEGQHLLHVDDVNVSKFSRDVNLKIDNLNPDVFNGVIDFEISKPRYSRRARYGGDV